MSVDEFKVEYPEHLNPFHHRRSTLARSFRGFKKAIVRSFTGKDRDKPTIRPKPEQPTLRNVMSMPPPSTEPPVLFPRSRFSERLSKTDALRSASRRNDSSLDRLENNPFEAKHENNLKPDVNGDTTAGISPIPAERKSKRRKKKAPVPPGSISGGSVNESKWSLVSTDSEMSSICYSENDVDYIHNNNINEKNEEILKITREIAKFTEDTNNNSISDQTPNDSDHIDGTNINNNNIEDKDEHSVKPTIHIEDIDEEKVTEAATIVDNTITNSDVLSDKITCKCDANNKCNDCTLPSDLEASPDDSGFIDDQKLSPDISNDSSTEILDDNLSKLQKDKKEDKAEDEHEEVPFTSEHVDESQPSESGLSVKGTIDYFEHTYASPSPKIRKNILTKEKLLGAE